MITLSINSASTIPVYKQLLHQFEVAVRSGKVQDGELVMSMNELSAALGISKETVKKVYSILRDKGLLEARQGKGFYIHIPHEGLKPTVLVIIDKLSAYKQTLLDSLVKTVAQKAEFTILLHNQDADLLEYYIDQHLGKFDYYVITPHFSLDDATQKRVTKLLSRIPNRQLILADHWLKSLKGNYGAVYQDYENDAAEGLETGVEKIKRKGALQVFILENSLYGHIIEQSVRRCCQKHHIDVNFHTEVTADVISKGNTYLLLNSSLDDGLLALSRAAKEKKLRIGKDISIISYNESPISEIVLGGLTTISTDFAEMGVLIGKMILSKRLTKEKCTFRMTRRSSF